MGDFYLLTGPRPGLLLQLSQEAVRLTKDLQRNTHHVSATKMPLKSVDQLKAALQALDDEGPQYLVSINLLHR